MVTKVHYTRGTGDRDPETWDGIEPHTVSFP